MTCIRDIMTEEALEREFRSIRQVLKDLSEEEKPLRIEWGTREAMERHERTVAELMNSGERKEREMMEELSTKSIAMGLQYIVTRLEPDALFHDDYVSEDISEGIVIRKFPYMHIFGDFRLFNGLTIRAADRLLAKLVPIFIERKEIADRVEGSGAW